MANLKSQMHPFYTSKSLKAAHVNTRVEVGSNKCKISIFLLFPKSLLWKVHRKPLLVSPSAVVAGGDPKNSKKCAQLTPVANLRPPMHPFYIPKSLKAAHVNTRVWVSSQYANFQFFRIFQNLFFGSPIGNP